MQEKRVSFRQRLEYALFQGMVWLLDHSPSWLRRLEAKALGGVLKMGSPRHARLVARNLELAFPAAGKRWRSALEKAVYRHFSRVFIELAHAVACRDRRFILERTQIIHLEILERVLEKKRGVIVFSAHFGNWEWIPPILSARLGKEICSIARPMDNALIEKRVRAFREALGSRIIYKRGSLRTILKRLENNEIVLLMIDQNTVPREGVFVEFFGRKATAVTSVSQLHLKRGIPAVPLFLHYEGRQIVLEVLPEVQYGGDGDAPEAVGRLTQQLTSLIEAQVRRFPEQWFWFHDRWKTRPQGEKR
ncbi:MAG: lysophospholipid acyltransferase family protein [Candidatus Aminicenantes bacterium]|nr:lysophospholipid acyltransferase family protein [Candidatus Aminicenantes bacterium]